MESAKAGMCVMTTRGQRIGVLADAREDAVLLKLVRGTDLWIERAAIFTIDDGKVTLICEEDGLHRYAVATA